MPEHVTPERTVHPVLFLILFLPLGVTGGYVVVTLGYSLSQHGVGVAAIASLVALSLFPQTWKFVFGPLVDTTLTIKSWYFISAILTGIFVLFTAIVPPVAADLFWIEVFVVLFSVTSGLNSLAADSLMAHGTLESEKGRAGGWSQAGNLGGMGLGGGLGLWLAQHVHPIWISGAALGLVCVAGAVALPFLAEPEASHRVERYLDSLKNVGRDVLGLVASRAGLIVVFLMILPIGVGSAANLWSAVAGDWRASADLVALINGVLSGVVSMVGCLIGGTVADRMDRKLAFVLFGLFCSAAAIMMAIAPRTPSMFVVFTLLYALVTGLSYAAWGAVVLEAIGKGAAATKYNVLAGLSNIPIAYQTVIDGYGQTHFGSNGMLGADAAAGVLGVAAYFAFAWAVRNAFRSRTLAVSAEP